MRPLDRLPSIKLKLGIVIVAAVGVTVVVVVVGVEAGVPALALGGIAGLLALGMVQFLARGMTSPLREMSAAARAMAKGDYGRRVTASSSDEVGELARAFNKMAAELAETDRIRRDLVANVSHDLRTPITALQAVLENLVDDVEHPDKTTLRTMLGQVERLGRLVSQVLDLSRLESGVVPVQMEPFPLRSLIDQAVRECELHRSPVRMNTTIDPADLCALGDRERMHQVVMNLLENAIRHSPPEGRILVAARSEADRVTIEVADDGAGIPPGDSERIFDRFYRADPSRSGEDGGSGLGLAIARWIVDIHGGEIRAENRKPHGCRVLVELPKAPVKVTGS
ncbi:MAG: ATP-binding protein [Actinomycetota bacterium]